MMNVPPVKHVGIEVVSTPVHMMTHVDLMLSAQYQTMMLCANVLQE